MSLARPWRRRWAPITSTPQGTQTLRSVSLANAGRMALIGRLPRQEHRREMLTGRCCGHPASVSPTSVTSGSRSTRRASPRTMRRRVARGQQPGHVRRLRAPENTGVVPARRRRNRRRQGVLGPVRSGTGIAAATASRPPAPSRSRRSPGAPPPARTRSCRFRSTTPAAGPRHVRGTGQRGSRSEGPSTARAHGHRPSTPGTRPGADRPAPALPVGRRPAPADDRGAHLATSDGSREC